MAKSFLLRDRDGRVCGYLQIQQCTVRCRLMESTEEGLRDELILQHNDKQTEHFALKSGTAEQCFPFCASDGQVVSGAVVVRGGHVHLYTDERAVYMHDQFLQRKKRAQWQSENTAQPERTEDRLPSSAKNPSVQQEQVWPQRRWPPPLCIPHAVYVQGRWLDCSEGIPAED